VNAFTKPAAIEEPFEMTVRRTATATVATTLALAVTGVFAGGAAHAVEGPATTVAAPAPESGTAEPSGTTDPAEPADAVVAPLPTPEPAVETAPSGAEDDPAAAAAPGSDAAPGADATPDEPAADAAGPVDGAAAPTTPTAAADETATDPAPVDTTDPAAEAAPTARALADASSASPAPLRSSEATVPAFDHLWIDNGCDYWYFLESEGASSGRAWEGWNGQPQIHFLFHELRDADGATRIVYDRDIMNSWYHPGADWEDDGTGTWVQQPSVGQDIDGMHWENGPAQQTVVFNGYKGGAADARAFFQRAGVQHPGTLSPEYREQLRAWGYTDEQIEQIEAQDLQRAAYEATQFAVWYFSTGHDVMGLFFQVDADGHVSLTDKALQQFAGDPSGADWTRNWGDAQGRMSTLDAAAWLIESALSTHVVAPQPGFVPAGYSTDADGTTRYGFAVTLVGGTGSVDVELRTADGSPVPAGVTLVDRTGAPATTVRPGDLVYVRVPVGVDVASLPSFQVWGSATGTQQGTPDYFVGEDHTHSSVWDEDSQQWVQPSALHHLIGLGSLDQPTVGRDWIGVDLLAQDPADPEDPEDPADPDDPTDSEDPADPAVDPAGPAADPLPATDPVVAPVADVVAAAVPASDPSDPTDIGAAALARTGADAGALVAVSFVLVAAGAAGLVIRRRVAATR